MINKKSTLLFFISLIVICLTVSAVSAADNDSTAVTDTQSAELEKTVDDATTIIETKESKTINKTNIAEKDVKSAASYYVSNDGKSSNSGTESSPLDLETAVTKVVKDKGGSITLNAGTYKISNTMKFNVAGTYTLTGKSGSTVTIDGSNKCRLIYVANSANLNVKNIVFTNAKDSGVGGAIFGDTTSKVTVDSCTFNSNTGAYGGAIYARGNSLEVKNSKFNKNTATGSGGAVYHTVNNAVINKNTFTANTATGPAGAIYSQGTNCKITDNTFTENSGSESGAILNIRSAKTTITGNTFTKNIAKSGGGGAITNNNDNNTEIKNNNFNSNSADKGDGGAIICYETTKQAVISNNDFTSNNAGRTAGAIFTAGKDVTISNNKFIQNKAQRTGGAVYDEGKGLTVNDNEFTKNTVTNDSGALYVRGTNANILNNKFDSNTANRLCGALYINGNNDTAKDNTFTNNKAAQAGGALYIDNAANVIVRANTFTKNTAGTTGGAITINKGDSSTIITNKFTENTASKSGGAISADSSNKVTIGWNTFTSNTAKADAGAIIIYSNAKNVNIKENSFNSNKATNKAGAIMVDGTSNIITTNNFTSNVATNSLGGAIANYGKSTQIINNNFIANSANYDKEAIRDNAQATKSNNKNADTSKCSATIYNGGASATISNNVFTDKVETQNTTKQNTTTKTNTTKTNTTKTNTTKTNTTKTNTTVTKTPTVTTVQNANGIIGNSVTFTATVKDNKGNNINEGTLTFKLNGSPIKNSKGQIITTTVKNGNAKMTITATTKLNNNKITADYSGTTKYNASTSTNTAKTTFTQKTQNTTKQDTTSTKKATTVNVQDTYGIIGNSVTFYATVKDANGNKVNGGNLVFKIKGITLKNSKGEGIKTNVVNGTARMTITAFAKFNNGDIVAKYNGTEVYEGSTSTNDAKTIYSPRSAKAVVSVSTTAPKQYEVMVVTVKLSDVTANTAVSTIANNNKAYVILKLNGKTCKNSLGDVIKLKVNNGVATFNYRIPKGMAGYTNSNATRYYNITACLSHPDYQLKESTSAQFTVKRSDVTITPSSVVANMTSRKLTVKATLKDYKNNNLVGTSNISIKINGITQIVKGSNIIKVNNGVIDQTIDIPSNVKSVSKVEIVTGQRTSYEGARLTISNVTKA